MHLKDEVFKACQQNLPSNKLGFAKDLALIVLLDILNLPYFGEQYKPFYLNKIIATNKKLPFLSLSVPHLNDVYGVTNQNLYSRHYSYYITKEKEIELEEYSLHETYYDEEEVIIEKKAIPILDQYRKNILTRYASLIEESPDFFTYLKNFKQEAVKNPDFIHVLNQFLERCYSDYDLFKLALEFVDFSKAPKEIFKELNHSQKYKDKLYLSDQTKDTVDTFVIRDIFSYELTHYLSSHEYKKPKDYFNSLKRNDVHVLITPRGEKRAYFDKEDGISIKDTNQLLKQARKNKDYSKTYLYYIDKFSNKKECATHLINDFYYQKNKKKMLKTLVQFKEGTTIEQLKEQNKALIHKITHQVLEKFPILTQPIKPVEENLSPLHLEVIPLKPFKENGYSVEGEPEIFVNKIAPNQVQIMKDIQIQLNYSGIHAFDYDSMHSFKQDGVLFLLRDQYQLVGALKLLYNKQGKDYNVQYLSIANNYRHKKYAEYMLETALKYVLEQDGLFYISQYTEAGCKPMSKVLQKLKTKHPEALILECNFIARDNHRTEAEKEHDSKMFNNAQIAKDFLETIDRHLLSNYSLRVKKNVFEKIITHHQEDYKNFQGTYYSTNTFMSSEYPADVLKKMFAEEQAKIEKINLEKEFKNDKKQKISML